MAKTVSLGVDIGSVSTKAAVLDGEGRILASGYLWTEGNPVAAVQELLRLLRERLPRGTCVRSVGTTGSGRRLIGAMLGADAVKNEITAHAVGTLSRYPDVRTILEIGGQDSKIILLENGVVVDYAMNSLCAAGTGAFLSAQAGRLGLTAEELGEMALRSRRPARIAARCTVFAESDMIHKAQAGHPREDLVAGLCHAVAANYLAGVGKGKRIRPPIVFQGGVSKNRGVAEAFRTALKAEIHVGSDSHLMGAVGAALLSKGAKRPKPFDFQAAELSYETAARYCDRCANRCEIVEFYREGALIDYWGERCEKGAKGA